MRHLDNNIPAAFDLLLEEIEAEIDSFNAQISAMSSAKMYAEVKHLADQAELATTLREEVVLIRERWHGAFATPPAEGPETSEPNAKASLGKLKKGLRTPERAYWKPILTVLVAFGGSARLGAVLDEVYECMKLRLNEYDLQPLPSDSDAPRWRNAAQWARNTLVKQGLMRSDSPHGIWEISDQGRKWLTEN
ncbi:Restriction system protein Mrr-like N-terminal domain containing protein [Fimbriimonadaceae bacterium]